MITNNTVLNIFAHIFLCIIIRVYVRLIPGSGNSGLRGELTFKILKDMGKLPFKNGYPFTFSPAVRELSGFSHPYHYVSLKQTSKPANQPTKQELTVILISVTIMSLYVYVTLTFIFQQNAVCVLCTFFCHVVGMCLIDMFLDRKESSYLSYVLDTCNTIFTIFCLLPCLWCFNLQ